MSTMQRLTLIGMYHYDDTLFANLSLPEGYNTDDFIDAFLLEHGEKCVQYTDIDFMKFAIGAVSKKWALELERIFEALTADYNPIENYDRNEHWEDDNNTTYGKTNKVDYTDSRTPNLSNTTQYGKTDTNTQTTDSETERKRSAFNSSSYEPDEKNTSKDGTRTLEQRGTDTVKTTGSDKNNRKGTVEGLSGTDYNHQVHDARIHGNIGVMTAASMVSEVVDQRLTKNLYDVAGRIFANELLIQIY